MKPASTCCRCPRLIGVDVPRSMSIKAGTVGEDVCFVCFMLSLAKKEEPPPPVDPKKARKQRLRAAILARRQRKAPA